MNTPNARSRAPCGRTVVAALLAALAASDLPLNAQTAAHTPRADPLDPNASVPAFTWRSTLAGPRPPIDEKPLSWREANDAVARIGGWRVYAREAQQPAPEAASATPPAAGTTPAVRPSTAPPAGGHSGHPGPKSP